MYPIYPISCVRFASDITNTIMLPSAVYVNSKLSRKIQKSSKTNVHNIKSRFNPAHIANQQTKQQRFPFANRRPYPGRSGRGDPRLVRSLDLELLEEEAIHSRRLLEEERAKNKYLTTLIEDLKRYILVPRL